MRGHEGERRRLAATIALAVALLASCGPPAPVLGDDPPGPVRLSLFAFGDTGNLPKSVGREMQTQMRVARVLEAEQRRRPADALVLLGDNFYPDGLLEKELVPRVRENLVRPYCVFLALDGPESERVADACEEEHRGERPIPFYAVLGNHDTEGDSPRLQREVVPRFIPNWHMPAGPIELIELADSDLQPAVSLILYDALALAASGDTASLERALRASRGPWRILAGHYPLRDSHPGPWIANALAGVDVPVQLHLSGHDHNLQVGVSAPKTPYLQVVAGSGGSQRAVRHPLFDGRFALVQPGFARIDLIGEGDDARLFASLIALPVSSLAFWDPPRVVTRWSVGLTGDVREEPVAGL